LGVALNELTGPEAPDTPPRSSPGQSADEPADQTLRDELRATQQTLIQLQQQKIEELEAINGQLRRQLNAFEKSSHTHPDQSPSSDLSFF
jgi:hypothetical protein